MVMLAGQGHLAVESQLIPVGEMTPGRVAAIRNDVITRLVRLVAKELSKPEKDLVVRDIRPASDLIMYAGGTTTSGVDEWLYDATTTTANAFTTVTGDVTMADQRFAAIFGVRDLRLGIGVHTTAMELLDSSAAGPVALLKTQMPGQMVSFVRVSVGGSTKVIWDLSGMNAYPIPVGFTPYPVIIPQNTTYNIGYYFVTTAAGVRAYLQLIGVIVEPRGRTVSP